MYLGVHYFGDILIGTLIGFLYATLYYYIFQYFLRKHTERFKPNHDIRFANVPIITGLVSIWVIICTSGILSFYNIPLR